MARVVVIGAGLAGISAAAFAKRQGAEVKVIARSKGATGFCSGALDLAGDPCAPLARPGDRVPGHVTERVSQPCTDVRANIQRIISDNPFHPYAALAGESKDPAGLIQGLFKEAVSMLFPRHGLVSLAGSAEQNRACFTLLGTIKHAALFPSHTATPSSNGMQRPLVLGVRGLFGFDPSLFALLATEGAQGAGPGISPSAGSLDLGNGFERQAPEMSAFIEKQPEEFIQAMKQALEKSPGASAVVVPPVLPCRGRDELISRLSHELSLPVYELLSMPPSVHGLRLSSHLADVAAGLGIEVVRAEVTGFSPEGQRIDEIEIESMKGRETVEASAFVLASGKFMGGGIQKERSFCETVFDLPVFIQGAPAGEVFSGNITSKTVTESHGIFQAGLITDQGLRPAGKSGHVMYQNLFAAGSVLAGNNPAYDGTGAGTALITGAGAGKQAAGIL